MGQPKLLDCSFCNCGSYLFSLYCYCLASFLGLQAVLTGKRHILSGIDLNQPILYVAATAPNISWSVTLLKWCFNMSLFCFFPLTLSILNLPYSCHPSSGLVQMNETVLYSRNHFCVLVDFL